MPVAQLDRALDSDSKGQRFESSRARHILPTRAALDLCLNAGLPASHIIAMQDPFTVALNAATYDMLGVSVMVTKNSGAAGGVDKKIKPALARGIHVIVIRRP